MKRPLLAISLGLFALPIFAQTTPTTTTTVTRQRMTAVQNPDYTYTIVQYPVDKEVIVNMVPATTLAAARGLAKVLRHGDVTTINLELTGLPSSLFYFNVFAVDPAGHPIFLGPVAVSNGTVTQTFSTPLDKFMLVATPSDVLSPLDNNSSILFRSAVPEGLAVIPYDRTGGTGEKVSSTGDRHNAITTAILQGSSYNVPMLGIPAFRRGSDTLLKVNFAGEMTGARVNFRVLPRKDGPTVIEARFHELKDAPPGKSYVLWAVTPDNRFVKLGQIVNTPNRHEAEIKSEVNLSDFGLFITVEDDNETPSGPVLAVAVREDGIGTVRASILSVPEGMNFEVKYCPWADCYKGGKYVDDSPLWLSTTTGSSVPLDQPQRYIFTYTDHDRVRRHLVVDCQQNCEVKCVY